MSEASTTAGSVLWEEVVPGGNHWSGLMRRGTILRLTALAVLLLLLLEPLITLRGGDAGRPTNTARALHARKVRNQMIEDGRQRLTFVRSVRNLLVRRSNGTADAH